MAKPKGKPSASRGRGEFRTILHTMAFTVERIPALGREGDRRADALIIAGVEVSQGLCEELVRGEYREPVERALRKLRDDDLPQVLPHCDPSLRDRVDRLIVALDLDSLPSYDDGGHTIRWRQRWEGAGLDTEVAAVARLLRTHGDRTPRSSRQRNLESQRLGAGSKGCPKPR